MIIMCYRPSFWIIIYFYDIGYYTKFNNCLTLNIMLGFMYKRITDQVIKQINPQLFVERAVRVEKNKYVVVVKWWLGGVVVWWCGGVVVW